jgi:hypothetical protein
MSKKTDLSNRPSGRPMTLATITAPPRAMTHRCGITPHRFIAGKSGAGATTSCRGAMFRRGGICMPAVNSIATSAA